MVPDMTRQRGGAVHIDRRPLPHTDWWWTHPIYCQRNLCRPNNLSSSGENYEAQMQTHTRATVLYQSFRPLFCPGNPVSVTGEGQRTSRCIVPWTPGQCWTFSQRRYPSGDEVSAHGGNLQLGGIVLPHLRLTDVEINAVVDKSRGVGPVIRTFLD